MGESPSSWLYMHNNPRPSPPNSSSSSSTFPNHHPHPESWSQLLQGEEENRFSFNPFQSKRVENWVDQVLYPSPGSGYNKNVDMIKQEILPQGGDRINEELIQPASWPTWGAQALQTNSPSPRSCVTTSISNSVLDFSSSKADHHQRRNHPVDPSSEDKSSTTGSAVKKARIQTPSSNSTLKARKEKVGERISALHQLVSPFGKTDTASVLLETFGYIRFLQSQIEALSSPYLGTGLGNTRQSVHGERSCIFPEDHGQLLNVAYMNKRGPSNQEDYEEQKPELRSRGLCLVPVSFMLHAGCSDNGADYWAPSFN